MARRVIWTKTAQNDRKAIFTYWTNRNKSKKYARKLQSLFKESLTLISKNPKIGKQTDLDNVRIKIVQSYLLFYQFTDDFIYVLTIWDSRQNPDKLEVKKASR